MRKSGRSRVAEVGKPRGLKTRRAMNAPGAAPRIWQTRECTLSARSRGGCDRASSMPSPFRHRDRREKFAFHLLVNGTHVRSGTPTFVLASLQHLLDNLQAERVIVDHENPQADGEPLRLHRRRHGDGTRVERWGARRI